LLEALSQALGPADRYEATVVGANSSGTHFEKVQVAGVRVQRHNTPVIDSFDIELKDVSIDRPNKQVTGIGAARAMVRVTAADLTSYLQQQRWIGQPHVRLSAPDGVVVDGNLTVPGLGHTPSAPALFSGRLAVSGSRLLLVVDSLSIADRQAPPLVRSLVATAINPLLDLSAYAAPSRIDRVAVHADAIQLDASGSQMQVSGRGPTFPTPR
jgi:hypothetical protein